MAPQGAAHDIAGTGVDMHRSPQAPRTLGRLTETEKCWLKDNYGGEWKFLMACGLNMHKDEDREEGRGIMRALMSNEALNAEENDIDGEEEKNPFLRDLEEDPTSHVADYHFTSAQLDWIERHYQHTGNFLLTYGLKPFDAGDCQEGRVMVQGFMDGA
ncbi:hypothetical protein B0A55_08311 [Friedmanniomyces simplex]|uniref:Uncharacterized protein n=1 Tax=Friedmanniomyces simplex TaxID=329884 RepID=A0A4U0WUY6_9PEZI|nr:hypothetical protein B0A55_08311 [Friedmanniomyces simplex]